MGDILHFLYDRQNADTIQAKIDGEFTEKIPVNKSIKKEKWGTEK